MRMFSQKKYIFVLWIDWAAHVKPTFIDKDTKYSPIAIQQIILCKFALSKGKTRFSKFMHLLMVINYILK